MLAHRYRTEEVKPVLFRELDRRVDDAISIETFTQILEIANTYNITELKQACEWQFVKRMTEGRYQSTIENPSDWTLPMLHLSRSFQDRGQVPIRPSSFYECVLSENEEERKQQFLSDLRNGLYSDVVICVGESQFSFSKFDLYIITDFFRERFNQDVALQEVRIEDVMPGDFERVSAFADEHQLRSIQRLCRDAQE